MNLAIIIGISDYENCMNLNACRNDVQIMQSVLKEVHKYDDICIISEKSKAYEAKQKITSFINKHKDNSIDELFFYFSGHGARFEDDFFFVFTDFQEKRKEVTGLRNSELDGLIRNLSPDLTIKVVDACFSGTSYVKSEGDIKPLLEKSAKENKLKKLYFLHSSSSEEESLATQEYSVFSKSFFRSLTQNVGDIRHRDIMAYVADDLEASGYPKPTFIVQADNTEFFGKITTDVIAIINDLLKLNCTETDQEKVDNPISQDSNTFLDLVQLKSNSEYCSKDEGLENIKLLEKFLKNENWPPDVADAFEIALSKIENSIPNEIEIGRWLHKNNDKNYFVTPFFRTETYYDQEYVEIPRKPSGRGRDLFGSIALASAFSRLEKDYKLEKVEKSRKVIDGIRITTATPFNGFHICFTPKYNALENYAFTVVPIFSRKTLSVFSSIENLPYSGWESVRPIRCNEWKVNKIDLKNKNKIKEFCQEKIASVTTYIINDAKSKLDE